MKILGISAFYHDSAACILDNGNIVAAAQEERFTRKKHDASFPKNAIEFCLKYSGLTLNELDAIVFYEKPLLKFERLLETYYCFAPKGLRSFLLAMPVWISEKMFLKKIIRDELKAIDKDFISSKVKLLFPEHHLSHAASAFFPSAFEDAAILTIDGVGEWATASLCHGKNNSIKILHELRFPHSLGLLYSAFTFFLGFKVNSGEYKVMGLAPYGNPESEEVKNFVRVTKEKLVQIKDDGSIWLDQKYFDYASGLKMVNVRSWEKLFGISKRNPEDELKQSHCNLALAIQQITEEIMIKMAKEAKRITGLNNLWLSGGVALNAVANGRLIREKIFDNVFIQPASGDAGGALGAALATQYIYFKQDRKISFPDSMQGTYLGSEYSDLEIKLTAKKYKAPYEYFEKYDELADKVASLIAEGNIIGWFQGRMEFGPRALGNRSIIGDARNPEMQKKINLKIKYRENFRPFAPSVLAEDYENYFDCFTTSPYMLNVQSIKQSRKKQLPENYHSLPVKEKLYFLRSDIPAVTHIDFSARIHTVHKETNERYWTLINAFKEKVGYSLIVNTSFNVRGEPVVCSPEDAYRCFMRTEMDYLVVGNFLFDKKKQPEWKNKDNWKEEFTLD